MDPSIDSDWLGCKKDPIEEPEYVGNIARSWQWRERGINPPNSANNKIVLENVAEDILVQKPLKIRCCDLPGSPRSTFLMVFSPDGTKMASTHGNHNVYVSELASGKHVRVLQGHPRTPWCITFHPSHTQIIGSGCLGGQVRVWDISNGGSEVWCVPHQTVIASIAFHPKVKLLVIATYNDIFFWDWTKSTPFSKVSTNNVNEKVRYVAFDTLGYKLITGISSWIPQGAANGPLLEQTPPMRAPQLFTFNHVPPARREESDEIPSFANGPNPNNGQDSSTAGTSQDVIVNSYHSLVQRYDSLVRSYQRLFMFRHRMSVIPPPPATIDRGTDPMETDALPESSRSTRRLRSQTLSQITTQHNEDNPTPGTSRQQDEIDDEADSGSSRLLNLDVLSFDNTSHPNDNLTRRRYSTFGSRHSAFHPLHESTERTFRPVDQREHPTRLLPNPFFSTAGPSTPYSAQAPSQISFGSPINQRVAENTHNTARTSIFPSYRTESFIDLSPRRRRLIPLRLQMSFRNSQNERTSSTSTANNTRPEAPQSNNEGATNSGQSDSSRYSAFDLLTAPEDSQSINESLQLIRDILRDSGSRLVDLITRVSLSTLVGVGREESFPNNSDDSDLEEFRDPLQRNLSSSSSDSDSDHSLEVNIFRTPNSTFREEESRSDEQTGQSGNSNTTPSSSYRPDHPTDRIVFDLINESRNEGTSRGTGGFNVSSDSPQFHVRYHSNSTGSNAGSSSSDSRRTSETQPSFGPDFNPNRPSTSRDNGWTRSRGTDSEEAYRKVRTGVIALQKHTVQLTDMWLHGNTISLRELRVMWENLRRRVLMIHRDNNGQETPIIYTSSMFERCRNFDGMTEVASRTSGRSPRSTLRTEERTRSRTRQTSANANESATPDDTRPNDNEDRRTQGNRSPQLRRSTSVRSSPPFRRRLLPSGALFRWRPEDDLRRRSRIAASNRLSQRYSSRSRRDYARAIEIAATRHEIRMRAMQVLSVMFNSMMMCLEERGLSQVIINMLRLLKKALALTCLMLMTTRESARTGRDTATPSQRVDSLNVIRIQNIDHTEPINVDGPEESPNNSSTNDINLEINNSMQSSENYTAASEDTSLSNQPSTSAETNTSIYETPMSPAQRWSNRLAVQIAAANRNTSVTARNRRDMYMESKRLKALHRTNPTAHPLIKKRVLPPVTTHRIPSLRLPNSSFFSRYVNTPQPSRDPQSNAAPVGESATNENTRQSPSRLPPDVVDEFEQRINLIRLAHMQAVRLRNAARNRFRRLQTIRLYTPSSIRDMFSLQGPNNPVDQANRSSSQNESEQSNRRSASDFRSRVMGRDRAFSRGASEEAQFHTVFNNVAMPLMHVNDLPTNEVEGPQPQRPPRIHEYLQPIILAQNAMVVDEDQNGENEFSSLTYPAPYGGAGNANGPPAAGGESATISAGQRRLNSIANLLDSGIISEAFPAPAHRVQAWDFTKGATPDIANSTKNIVVSKCRIHNDASIDISKDGRILVALHPVPRLRTNNHWFGVYSLEWSRLGQCLHTAALEQSAVSVALSPTARHLAVGLGSRRFSSAPLAPHAPHAPHARNVFALLYRLDAAATADKSNRTGLSPVKELEQNWEHGFRSLNCLRWAPQPGQGFVYANNTGQLVIMS